MGLRFASQIFGSCFFVTTTFKDWRNYGQVAGLYQKLAESLLLYLAKYDALLLGYVFMPSHLHLLIIIDGQRLSGFMRDFKKYFAQKAIKDCGIFESQIWEAGFDRVAVFSEDIFRIKLQYIHNNPVKSGLAVTINDWRWSSAKYYDGDESGIIPVWKEWSI